MAHTATGVHHAALAAACSAQQRAHRESLGCGYGRRTARRLATGSGSASSVRSSTWSSHCPTRSSCRCVRTHARTHANAGCMLHAASDVARRPSHLQQRHSLYYADWFAPSLIHSRQCRIGILTPVRRQPVQSSAVLRAAAGCRCRRPLRFAHVSFDDRSTIEAAVSSHLA